MVIKRSQIFSKCVDVISHSILIFEAFSNSIHPFSGCKYDFYCLYILATSWKLSIFSKSVDMMIPRFCPIFVASKLAATPLLPSCLTDGTIWVRFSDIWCQPNLCSPLFNEATDCETAHWCWWMFFGKVSKNILTLMMRTQLRQIGEQIKLSILE